MAKKFFNNLRPVGDRVLLKFQKVSVEEKTSGGIIMPTSSTELEVAIVMAVGERVELNKVNFKIGDKVHYNDFDVKKIEDLDGTKYGLIRFDNVWACFD